MRLTNPGVVGLPDELPIPEDVDLDAFIAWWLSGASVQRRGFYRQALRVGFQAAWAAVSAPWEEWDLTLDEHPDGAEVRPPEDNQEDLDLLEAFANRADDAEDPRDA